jgi:hypothetical protein
LRAHHAVGREELVGEGEDVVEGVAAAREGGDALHDVGLGEPGPLCAQPGGRVDERREDLVGGEVPVPDGPIADEVVDRIAALEADGVRFAGPPVPEPIRGERAVLVRSGDDRGAVVGPHPGPGRLERALARLLEVLLDVDAAFGELPKLLPAEPKELPTAVAFGTPGDAQPFGQEPFELVEEHGPGGLCPDVQRVGVEGHERPVGAADQVGDQAVRVELGIAGS